MLRTVLNTLAVGLIVSSAALAEERTITDITGRDVTVDVPVGRVILGSGRHIYPLALLSDTPFETVVGWGSDLERADNDTYKQYVKAFPKISDLPVFGYAGRGEFDAEQAINLDADLVLFDLGVKEAVEESGLIETLGETGTPVVFIDLRQRPFEHTARTMEIMGEIFGAEERAVAFNDRRDAALTEIRETLAEAVPELPIVFMERAPGLSDECCRTFGNVNFGRMVELAGGRNMGSELLDTPFGTLSLEQVLDTDPDHIIMTGANWANVNSNGDWVNAGPGANEEQAREKIVGLLERPGMHDTTAAQNGNVHAIWHQFYVSPYNYVAVQQFAKWLHPELFADLDPDAEFRELHEEFLPIDYKPGYWVSLNAE